MGEWLSEVWRSREILYFLAWRDIKVRYKQAALGIACEKHIVSAHRTPDRLFAFAKGARTAGFKVIIAGAGGSAGFGGRRSAGVQ